MNKKNREQVIFPSVIARNQAELDKVLKKLRGVSPNIHLDVVDGTFAPGHSLDFPFRLPPHRHYRAHLMIENPEPWIKKNIHHIELFIPHFEEIKDPFKYIAWMKRLKRKVAWAILPETKVTVLEPYLRRVDQVLILTVHPGFYGGKYLKSELNKIKLIKTINPAIQIIVDGGMNPRTIREAARKGADLFVSGSYVTGSKDPKGAITTLQKSIRL